jgi:hypothetical protein
LPSVPKTRRVGATPSIGAPVELRSIPSLSTLGLAKRRYSGLVIMQVAPPLRAGWLTAVEIRVSYATQVVIESTGDIC